MVSAGDQVNTPNNENEYAGYFAPEKLKRLPVATVVVNHDLAVNYNYHFNNPNESNEYGVTVGGGNYYYTYGNTLFMMLNSNSTSNAQHKAFMEEAIAASPNSTWKVITMHHSMYSSASHSVSSALINRRVLLSPIMDELEIDVVLGGHDHCYTRSYQMLGNEPQLDQLMSSAGSVINPTGTLYITGNFASGSKYYGLQANPEAYAAVRLQVNSPTFSHIEVTDTSFKISTYRTDTLAEIDTYEIINPVETAFSATKEYLEADVLSQQFI